MKCATWFDRRLLELFRWRRNAGMWQAAWAGRVGVYEKETCDSSWHFEKLTRNETLFSLLGCILSQCRDQPWATVNDSYGTPTIVLFLMVPLSLTHTQAHTDSLTYTHPPSPSLSSSSESNYFWTSLRVVYQIIRQTMHTEGEANRWRGIVSLKEGWYQIYQEINMQAFSFPFYLNFYFNWIFKLNKKRGGGGGICSLSIVRAVVLIYLRALLILVLDLYRNRSISEPSPGHQLKTPGWGKPMA